MTLLTWLKRFREGMSLSAIERAQLFAPALVLSGLLDGLQIMLAIRVIGSFEASDYSILNLELSANTFLGCSLLIAIFLFIIQISTNWLLLTIGANISVGLSNQLFKKMIAQDYLTLSMREKSDFPRLIVQEAHKSVQGFLNPFVILLAKIFSSVVIVMILVFFAGPWIMLLFSVIGIIYAILFRLGKNSARRYSEYAFSYYAKRYDVVDDSFNDIRFTKQGILERFFYERFASNSEDLAAALAWPKIFTMIPKYSLEFFLAVSVVGIAWFSLVYHQQNTIVVSNVAIGAIALGVLKLLPAVQQIFDNALRCQVGLVSFEAVLESCRQFRDMHTGKRKMHYGQPLIAIDLLSFRYAKTQYILRNLSMTVESGRLLGLVAPSGEGKSTLLDILGGLLTASTGSVSSSSDLKVWRVTQDQPLIKGSVRENLCLDRSDKVISIEEEQILNRLGIGRKFWVERTRGEFYDVVGCDKDIFDYDISRSIGLSAGQIQRLVFARAIFSKSNFFLLDEFTANVDELNKEIMFTILREVLGRGHAAAIVVTHNTSDLKVCDHAYKLAEGSLVEITNTI